MTSTGARTPLIAKYTSLARVLTLYVYTYVSIYLTLYRRTSSPSAGPSALPFAVCGLLRVGHLRKQRAASSVVQLLL